MYGLTTYMERPSIAFSPWKCSGQTLVAEPQRVCWETQFIFSLFFKYQKCQKNIAFSSALGKVNNKICNLLASQHKNIAK
jgi:hypothetical protein